MCAQPVHSSSRSPNDANDAAMPPTGLLPPVGIAPCRALSGITSGFLNHVTLVTGRFVNLVKLCVGVSSVGELAMYQNRRATEAEARGESYLPSHVTRMFPRRKEEVLSGGSLYWVIRGEIQVRQTILDLESCIGDDAIRRCRIVMDPALTRTVRVPRRPFQGWRYLAAEESPDDLPVDKGNELPLELERTLDEIGIF